MIWINRFSLRELWSPAYVVMSYVHTSNTAKSVIDYVEDEPLTEAIEKAKLAVAGRPMMVDASQFVGNHNDIYGPDMGRFLAGVIVQHASAR